MKKRSQPKRTKLTKSQRRLASEFISEEVRTEKYPRKQAIAIGISRASKSKDAVKQRKTSRRNTRAK